MIQELDLVKCADSYVGHIGHGISGGERRRLAVAIELLNDPLMMFMDEPTSGLDSSTAFSLVKLMKDISVSKNQTVICTIHQPRASILPYFDKILVLAAGKIVYFGRPFPDALDFFASTGNPCPQYENLADFMLDLVNTPEHDEKQGYPKEHEDSRDVEMKPVAPSAFEKKLEVIRGIHDAYDKSSYLTTAMSPSTSELLDLNEMSRSNSLKGQTYPTPLLHQIWIIFCRSFLFKMRNPGVFASQAVFATVLPLIIGSLYFQMSLDQQALYDRVGAISFVVLLQSFMAYDIILLLPLERGVYLSEHQSGWYSASAFYWGRSLAEFPMHIALTLVVASITYWMFGLLNDVENFLFYILILELSTIAGASLLQAIGSFCKSADVANLVATLFLVIFMLFNGFQINLNNIPSYYMWLAQLSFLKWAVSAALYDQLSPLTFSCEGGVNGSCIQTGQEYLEFLGMGDVNIWFNVGILIVLTICFRVLSYIGLRFMYTGKTFRQVLAE